MHLAEGASNVCRMTGSSPSGWHTSFSSSKLSLSLEFWVRKLDESVSEFCSRHRKSGRVEEGSENLPSIHLHPHAQCPRTTVPNCSLEVGELVDFSRKCQVPPAWLQVHWPPFCSWKPPSCLCICCYSARFLESLPLQLKSLPQRGFPDGGFLDPVGRGLCGVLPGDISPAPSTVPGPSHRLIHLI
uniref:Uncharacterized protein n=1 Tax=Myotis myotis TaxID=51298 RepID=A0A7J7T5S6_MYOMY|nr:hypothetical protein mMyoMyo1_009178 [Myotis myotis]